MVLQIFTSTSRYTLCRFNTAHWQNPASPIRRSKYYSPRHSPPKHQITYLPLPIILIPTKLTPLPKLTLLTQRKHTLHPTQTRRLARHRQRRNIAPTAHCRGPHIWRYGLSSCGGVMACGIVALGRCMARGTGLRRRGVAGWRSSGLGVVV
jgi:hypothetical protein